MRADEIKRLAEVAAQVHANLMAIRSLAESDETDLRSAAEIVNGTAELINSWTPIRIRRRPAEGYMSVKAIWQDLKSHAPHVAKIVAAFRTDPDSAGQFAKPARNRLIAVGIVMYGILNCRGVRRALYGDLSRPVISVGPPDEDDGRTEGKEEPMPIKVRVSIKTERLAADLRNVIIVNLRDLADEVKKPPFNRVTVAELIGPVLNTIAEHVTVPPRIGGTDTSTSRQWIAMATKECLDRMGRLYAATLKRPSEGEALEAFRRSAATELVSVFITLRDIYLAPDIQRALAEADAKRE